MTHPIAGLYRPASFPGIFPRKFPALFGEGEHARIHAGAHKRDVFRNQAIDFKQGDAAM
jgi:hypothetical protein